jgi:hypothetical protein
MKQTQCSLSYFYKYVFDFDTQWTVLCELKDNMSNMPSFGLREGQQFLHSNSKIYLLLDTGHVSF